MLIIERDLNEMTQLRGKIGVCVLGVDEASSRVKIGLIASDETKIVVGV